MFAPTPTTSQRVPTDTNGNAWDIVAEARALTESVTRLVARVRTFYYAVVLAGHACPHCAGHLLMLREGRCQCASCGRAFDPTVAFQQCSGCGGRPQLQIRRYACEQCGQEVISRFLFDGLVFDAAYFREKMAASRQRRQAARASLQQRRVAAQSGVLEPLPIELGDLPELVALLNRLSVAGPAAVPLTPRAAFDLRRYETHLAARLGPIPIPFDELPPLSGNTLYDRIWRFIALLFLAQAGIVRIWQERQTIWVLLREADRKRQAVPGDLEGAPRRAGPVG